MKKKYDIINYWMNFFKYFILYAAENSGIHLALGKNVSICNYFIHEGNYKIWGL